MGQTVAIRASLCIKSCVAIRASLCTKPGVGQTIALRAFDAAKTSTSLTSAFPKLLFVVVVVPPAVSFPTLY